MTQTPAALPSPVRLYAGEGITTYAMRLAAANHTTVEDIEGALRQRGYLTSRARFAPDRLATWRSLGGLHDSAFTAPHVVAGNWVTERPLCNRCTGRHRASGRLPHVGHVCLRHSQWITDPQLGLRAFPTAVAAERRFRRQLAPFGVVFDSPVMLTAREAALHATTGPLLDQRRKSTGIGDIDVLVYPEQIRLARLLTHPGLTGRLTDPETPTAGRYEAVAQAIRDLVPDPHGDEMWRAIGVVWRAIAYLSRARRDAAARGRAPADGRYNLLPLIVTGR